MNPTGKNYYGRGRPAHARCKTCRGERVVLQTRIVSARLDDVHFVAGMALAPDYCRPRCVTEVVWCSDCRPAPPIFQRTA